MSAAVKLLLDYKAHLLANGHQHVAVCIPSICLYWLSVLNVQSIVAQKPLVVAVVTLSIGALSLGPAAWAVRQSDTRSFIITIVVSQALGAYSRMVYSTGRFL